MRVLLYFLCKLIYNIILYMTNIIEKVEEEITQLKYTQILNNHIVLSVLIYLGIFGLSDLLIDYYNFRTKHKILYYIGVLIIAVIFMFIIRS